MIVLTFYHNSKQHIQFVNYIKNFIDIPDDYINNIMIGGNDELDTMRKERLLNIKNNFDSFDVYIFEIYSLKIKKIDNFYIHLDRWAFQTGTFVVYFFNISSKQ